MVFIENKIIKIRSFLNRKGLDDPRFFGLIALAVIGLTVMWNGVRVVDQNYGLLQKIARLEEENRILELENRNKTLQNEYYKTAEFAEIKARRVNGKALPGEAVYTMSENVALAALKTPEGNLEKISTSKEQKPRYQQNFEAWVDFFFSKN